mgnify:CR=1 FL=1
MAKRATNDEHDVQNESESSATPVTCAELVPSNQSKNEIESCASTCAELTPSNQSEVNSASMCAEHTPSNQSEVNINTEIETESECHDDTKPLAR